MNAVIKFQRAINGLGEENILTKHCCSKILETFKVYKQIY